MVQAIVQYIVRYVLKLSGAMGWLAGKILDFGGLVLVDKIKELLFKKKRQAEQEKELKELEDVAKNPEKTPEEIAKEYADAINAGRK